MSEGLPGLAAVHAEALAPLPSVNIAELTADETLRPTLQALVTWAHAKLQLEAWQAKALELKQSATQSKFAVVDLTTYQTAADWQAYAIRVEASAETLRKSLSGPIYALWQEINAWFKPYVTSAQEIKRERGAVMAQYTLAQQALAAQAAAAAAAAHAQHRHAEAVQHLTVQASAGAAADSVVAGGSVKQVWEAEIYAPAEVPREWCDPSETRINANARLTASNVQPTPIAGVRYKLVASTTRRGVK